LDLLQKQVRRDATDGAEHHSRLAQTVVWQARQRIQVRAPAAGKAIIAPPSPIKASGPIFQVDTRAAALVLRRDPRIPRKDGNSNVVAWLPDGHLVQAVGKGGNGRFLEVETSLLGAHHRGFAPAGLLKSVRNISEVPVINPALTTSATGIVATYMPRS
jgi:hypothetical protein